MNPPTVDPAIKPGQKIYFLGIGGTGMSSVAGLCQEAGFTVCGSDAGVYPPTSVMLDTLKIPYHSPYNAHNVVQEKPDLVVVANALSRGNPELEKVLADGIPYTSFPQLLGDRFLKNRTTCVVAGTHGKTTTTALLAHILLQLGEDPGFLIGGLPKKSNRSFVLGQGPVFVIEGDEYDTAFFDKGPKFLHYHPQHLLLNNIEFDHADIYGSLDAVIHSFEKLIKIVDNPQYIVANCDDEQVHKLLNKLDLEKSVTRCSTLGLTADAEIQVIGGKPYFSSGQSDQGLPLWEGVIHTQRWGKLTLKTHLTGRHNLANLAQVLGCLLNLEKAGKLKNPLSSAQIQAAIGSFEPPQRRLDLLGTVDGTMIFEDFAHHPTAVRMVLESLRAMYPLKKITVAFEPRSATNRRNIFHTAYVQSLGLADHVLIGEVLSDARIPPEQRFNPQQLAFDIGKKAISFERNDDILQHLQKTWRDHAVVVFMSSGSFSGIQHKVLKLNN